jgi:predicted GTPase
LTVLSVEALATWKMEDLVAVTRGCVLSIQQMQQIITTTHHPPKLTQAKDIHYFRSTCTFHYDGSIPLLSSPLLLPATMPPKNKKKGADDGDAKFMRAARFGRVKNDLKMGFVGLPNVGKSTLTNILAGACHAEAANYVRYFWFIDNIH